MNEKAKAVQIFLVLSKVIFVVLIIVNLVSPLTIDRSYGPHLLNIVAVLFWMYGFLASLGFFKKVISEDEDGVVTYDTPIPIIQIGLVRIVEFLYYYWKHRETFNYKVFVVMIVIDVLYLLVLLMDKSTYYYVSIKEED